MPSGSETLTEWDSEYDALRVAIDPASGGLRYSQVLVKLFRAAVVGVVLGASVVVGYGNGVVCMG